MTGITPPYVFNDSRVSTEDCWLSCCVLIAESHISIHTFPEKNFVSVDIFSCKAFDLEFAGDYFKEQFVMAKVECNVLDRGTEFPKEMNGASRMAPAERRRVVRPTAPRHA